MLTKMKSVLKVSIMLMVNLLFYYKIYAQNVGYTYITPDSLFSLIQNSPKISIIQYWVPSCENATRNLHKYANLHRENSEDVDFYFIALTKKISLLEELERKVNFNSSIYLMDTLNSGSDLFENKSTFNKQFFFFFGLKKKEDFLIAYIHKKSGTMIFTDKLKIDEKKIRKMMKKK